MRTIILHRYETNLAAAGNDYTDRTIQRGSIVRGVFAYAQQTTIVTLYDQLTTNLTDAFWVYSLAAYGYISQEIFQRPRDNYLRIRINNTSGAPSLGTVVRVTLEIPDDVENSQVQGNTKRRL